KRSRRTQSGCTPRTGVPQISDRVDQFFQDRGPGLITGCADDDPSGISTYVIAGAAFGDGTERLLFQKNWHDRLSQELSVWFRKYTTRRIRSSNIPAATSQPIPAGSCTQYRWCRAIRRRGHSQRD